MAPLNHKSLAECKTKVLYRAWKGQLFIQDQQLCDIVLQSPFSISIPAQLPAKLEIRHAVDVSELRKKLPETALRRKNYADHEVRYQDTLFYLYEVEISNQNELKVEQLIESMKEKKLALIKYLNDQGALILLSSSAFVTEKDADTDELSCLQALFLISSPGPQCSAAKDWKCEWRGNERSLQVTLVLPGLHHALLEAAKHPDREGPPPGALVKRQIREIAKRHKNSHLVSESLDSPPVSFDMFSKKSDLDALSEKCLQNSFAHLQFYLSHPQNYTLEMSAAVACLDASSQSPSRSSSSNTQNPDSLSGLDLDLTPPEASEISTRLRRAAQLNLHSNNAAAKTSQTSDRPLQWCKRKSSRLLGASVQKMWSPMKSVCIMENSKNWKKSKKKKKKKRSPSPPPAKAPESPADSKELMLKLKNIQYPLRRKRGAQVLSAEFVQGTKSESPVKAPSSSESPAVTEKKPRLVKLKKDEEKAKSEERTEIRRPVTRQSAQRCMEEARLEAQKEVDDKSDPEGKKTTTQDPDPSENKEECDSHALNMLADLALSSCNSPLVSNGDQSSLVLSSLQEHQHLPGEMLQNSSDHEYHRDMKKLENTSLSGTPCQHSLSSLGEGGLSPELPSSSQESIRVSTRKKGNVKPGSMKSSTVLPREAADNLDPNIQSLISVEHSYASPTLDSSKKGSPGSPDSKNGVKYLKSGPLALPGKVLPFRHQQNICHPHKQLKNSVQFIRSAIMAARLKEDFSKSHKVIFRDRTVKVTFQWEAEYLFSLDSKYTNNSLEKTVVRAVHGPWDASQSNDIEEMKLILNMWVALFYSKPIRSSTARKVVEHSNPAKYISLNSVIDPLELIDDSEGAYSLEKCPADSLSMTNLASSEVKEKAIFPSAKPPSCNKLTSTNSIKDEFLCANPKEPHNVPSKREELQATARSSEDTVSPLTKVVGGEPERDSVLDSVLPVESPRRNPSRKPSGGCSRPQKLRVDAESESGGVVSLGEVSQGAAPPADTKLSENSRNEKQRENIEAGTSAESWETSGASPLAKKKKESHQSGGMELPPTSEVAWLEASAQEDGGPPCGKVIESQDLPMDEEDGVEESVEWESIDLALSDSNDTDGESRNGDLEQEGEDLPQETGSTEEKEAGSMCGMALPAESLLTSVTSPATVSEHQMELPSTEEDSIASPASFASLSQKNMVESFSLSRENTVDSRVDSVPPQASSVPGEEMELPASEDTSVSAKHPNQMDVDENSFLSWGNKGSKSVDSASAQDSKLFQAEKDLETQGKLERSQDSLVSVRNPLFPNPDDLTDISCDSMEERDLNLANSVSPRASLVHHMSSDAVVELLGDQEASTEPTKHHIFLNRMDLIEDISQDDIHLEDSAPLQTCEGYQTQNSMLTQREATENREDSVPSAQSLAPAKEIVLMQGSCVPQKEEEIHLVDAAHLPGGPDHQTADGVTELVGNQEDPFASATATALPKLMDLAKDSCIFPGKKVSHLQANEAVQIQQTRAIVKAQKTKKTELLDESQAEKEFQSLEANNRRFVLNSEEEKCCDKDENIGASPTTQEVTSDYKINEVAVTVSEEVKSVLGELIDTVSAMTVEHEETCPQETSSSNWISSVTLECVTPPDSEEETTTTDHLNEDLEQHSIFAHQEKAISQERALYHSALHENMGYGQVNMFERRTHQGAGPASPALDILPSSSGTDWSAMRTSLLCKSPLVKIVTPKEGDPTASMLGKTEVRHISHQASMSEGEDHFSERHVEILPCVPTEPQVEHMDGDTRDGLADSEDVWRGDARQSLEVSGDVLKEIRTKILSSPEETLASEKAQLPARASSGMNKDWEDESFPVDGDQEHVGSSYPSDKSGGSCSTRSTAVSQAMVAGYVSDLSPEEEIHESGDWRYLENTDRLSAPDPEAMEHDWPLVFKESDRSLDTKNEPGPLKDYVNFSVTKKHKEKTRTFHSSKRHESFTGEFRLINSLNRTWRTQNNPTQNTLDMECLRFHYKVKQLLRKPQLPTSTDAFAKELSPPLIAGTLALRKVPEIPPLNPSPRSRSPLLITIVNPSLRHGVSHWYPRRSRYRDSFEPPPFASSQDSLSKAARSKSQGQGSVAPFHLNKLTYKNKLKESRGDISVIMDEFAEFSRVMTSGNRLTSNKGREPNTTSEDAPEKRGPSLPKRTASYEHLFTELCNTLHFRLKNVAQEACKKTYAFYLMETEDDPFFGRVKNLLKKGGHTEMEPLLFCKSNHVETERLMVIIRNEDIFPHIHKIPCLLRLKRFPSVTFAGIDSPEDPLDHTYQELFQNGGFVVSDDKVLEMMTVGELKEMVKTLEKLNGHGRWRWLLHYKEMKKLREDARVDPAAHAKESLLKSCQGANITEALHYHQCDSRAALRSEHMNCLLNLQVQHISQRFAVFLTEKPSTSREALENKGILALDVNAFIATAEDMAAPFRSSSY